MTASHPAIDECILQASKAGCPADQVFNFLNAGICLQEKQLQMAAAARACDAPDGPVSVAVGGARGGGKSVWMICQLAADDCQRFPGLKCLWLRQIGKTNREHLEDLHLTTLSAIPHEYKRGEGILNFPNGSRIVCGHFKDEKDIDDYLGLEYDVIAIEELTTLTADKYRKIRSVNRSSKPGWRPRDYNTFNPGGVGHQFVKQRFYAPWKQGKETETRFIPSLVMDNRFNNPEYIKILQSYTGWLRRAWLEGDMDILAGQFFVNWREAVHVIPNGNWLWDDREAMVWWAAMDYGMKHYTVCQLFAYTGGGDVVVVDEHASREQSPPWHAARIREMFARHGILSQQQLRQFVCGHDMFKAESDGSTIAARYADEKIILTPAEIDRVTGWASISNRLGNPDNGVSPKLFVHRNCKKLIEQIPLMQNDPIRPEDVLKVDVDEDGNGGDDAADCCRMGVNSFTASQPLTWAQSLERSQAAGETA